MRRRLKLRRSSHPFARMLRSKDGVVVLAALAIIFYLVGGQDFFSFLGLDEWGEEDVSFVTSSPMVIAGSAHITDGDSLRIQGERIRILGIDAPELGQDCFDEGGQAIKCGVLSSQYMAGLIDGRPVSCRWLERDKYRRILGHCFVEEADGTVLDLNRAMVEDGWAFSYSSYPREERQALTQKRGMWRWKVQKPQGWRRAHPCS